MVYRAGEFSFIFYPNRTLNFICHS